jgi:hypothetical protein
VATRKPARAKRGGDASAEADEPDSCTHTWVIDPPNGPTSEGHCKLCGEKREFRNSYEYTPSWTARSGRGPANKRNAAAGDKPGTSPVGKPGTSPVDKPATSPASKPETSPASGSG